MKHADSPSSEQTLVKPKICISFDVEATGPTPSNGSMVMLGCVAFLKDQPKPISEESKEWILDGRQWCLEEITPKDPICWQEFWVKNLPVWEEIQKHKIPAEECMSQLATWIEGLSEKCEISWVAYPAAYDWMWLKTYYEKFGPNQKIKIGHKADCISSLKIMAETLGRKEEYLNFVTPKKLPLSHTAVEDATRQAYIYLKTLEWIKINSQKQYF